MIDARDQMLIGGVTPQPRSSAIMLGLGATIRSNLL